MNENFKLIISLLCWLIFLCGILADSLPKVVGSVAVLFLLGMDGGK